MCPQANYPIFKHVLYFDYLHYSCKESYKYGVITFGLVCMDEHV
jgi:hypothetical protein